MPDYVLGNSARETSRLINQAGLIQTITENVFSEAGIRAGMRVLDLGCGAGDVSFAAAKLVGPSGSVTGIDRDPAILDRARSRAADAGLTNTEFIHSAIDVFPPAQPFDAVVSRFFLLYQADPAQTLAVSAKSLKVGGVLASIETDMSVGLVSSPRVALWEQVGEWILAVFRQAGIHVDMGAKLFPTLIRAGFPGPRMRTFRAVCGGTDSRLLCQHYSDMVRSILPKLAQSHIATNEEVQVDLLAERLEAAISAANSQVFSMPLVAAWTRKPAE